ncbi:type I-B CRISPR-associated protein Cas5b [Halococcus thailandensis]|uniref:CRISPR-associated protein Cas5 n=1 Tax=Halococcus thailandensis JCM 13552 TaxID=1227457 RepID=M0NIB5_9EURY|nr:type I-B CRISPR-associated protein Cas5b [Halococcus thailandensis]EMA56844.1 CRISPR-associated protein Cas5 [Halococcus thailandensis JCM 13552]
MTQQDITDHVPDGGKSSDDQSSTSGSQFVPNSCIGFDVTADFAHFRKVGNNSAKPSYRIPPRTTVAGLLAGIMGMPRDSYYDLFSPDSSAIAVVPKELPHTYTMGITTVNTKADDAIQYLPHERSWQQGAEMLTPKSYVKYDRQRDTYEMLVDPIYRIYVALDDRDVHDELRERLEDSRYHYSPALGLSECIADIRNVDVHSVESASTDVVDSAAYDASTVIPRPGITIKRERAPLYMEATDNGRKTTAFDNITYATGDDRLPVNESRAYTVGEHRIVFC